MHNMYHVNAIMHIINQEWPDQGKKYDAVQPGKKHYLTFKKEKTENKH